MNVVVERVATVALTLLVWEGVRFLAWRKLRDRWQRSIGTWMRRHDVKLEQFRFIDRIWVRQTLLQDPELDRAAAESAKAQGIGIGLVRARMEGWLDEMVPYFNVFSYYKLGGAVATWATRLAYELVFDREGLERARAAIPPGAVTVYVANHRSNADYIVLSVGAMRQVALSYAVGEWARVWPLDVLFRSFGSYLIRRGEKDPLYHQVLSRYLQLVASRGLTTAFFLEGALSRDGAFRVPKVGLLDYLVGILAADPDRQIAFVPVGINFDRVLEDRNLTAETADAPPPRARDKFISLKRILGAAPRVMLSIFGPRWLSSHRKYGYASVQFGEVVTAIELEPDILAVARLPRKERLARVAGLADKLMERVSEVVPATPVVLVCRSLLKGPRSVIELRRAVRADLAELRAAGRRIARGDAFSGVVRGQDELLKQEHLDSAQRVDFDREVLESEEAERMVDLAFLLLKRRAILSVAGDVIRVEPRDEVLLRYYARSLDAPKLKAAG